MVDSALDHPSAPLEFSPVLILKLTCLLIITDMLVGVFVLKDDKNALQSNGE